MLRLILRRSNVALANTASSIVNASSRTSASSVLTSRPSPRHEGICLTSSANATLIEKRHLSTSRAQWAGSHEETLTEVDKLKMKKRTEVTYDELLELIKSSIAVLIDVRQRKELEDTGALPGAINIPLTELKAALLQDESQFAVQFGVPKPAKDSPNVVFYALSNVKSTTALEVAHKQGFKKWRHYPGGWQEWAAKQAPPQL